MSAKIRVVTRKGKFANSSLGHFADLEIEGVKDIDHDDAEDRKWLAKHCWWAMRSARVVTTYPL